MPELNRGGLIKGYFITNINKRNRLFGARWLHCWECGSFVNSRGVTRGVSFFMFYANELADDPSGLFKESIDFDMIQADGIITDAVCGDLLKRVPITTAKLSTLDAEQKRIIQEDFPTGFTNTNFGTTRQLVKLQPEWLGKRLAAVIRDRPNIWQPTIDPETGLEIPNIWKCSLEPTND